LLYVRGKFTFDVLLMATRQKPLILTMAITWSWLSTFLLQQLLDECRVICVSMPGSGSAEGMSHCFIHGIPFVAAGYCVSRYRVLWSRAGLRNSTLYTTLLHTHVSRLLLTVNTLCIFGPVAHTTKNRGIIGVKAVYGSMCLLRTFEKSSNSYYLIILFNVRSNWEMSWDDITGS
jgi:hypothetical protein